MCRKMLQRIQGKKSLCVIYLRNCVISGYLGEGDIARNKIYIYIVNVPTAYGRIYESVYRAELRYNIYDTLW